MKAWRIRLQADDGRQLNWADAVVRFMVGVAITLMAGAGSVLLVRHARWPEFLIGGLLWAPAIVNFAWIAWATASSVIRPSAHDPCATA